MKKIPDFLYKYRSFDSKNQLYKLNAANGKIEFNDLGLDGISKGKIWFSHLDNLNDPYEDEYDYNDENYYKDLMLYKSSFPNDAAELKKLENAISDKKKKRWSDVRIIKWLEEKCGENSLKKQLESFKEVVRIDKIEKTGILSLCENFDNLLMWAHYGNEHKGYCLQFSSKYSHCGKKKLLKVKNVYPVDYNDRHYRMEDVDPFHRSPKPNKKIDSIEEEFCKEKIYCHKSLVWSNENEWRIIHDISKEKKSKTDKGALIDFPGKLTAVYFGAEATNDCISALKDAVKKGKFGYTPKYYKMSLKKDVFGLDYEKC